MRWGWLLPDASYQVIDDCWERHSYRPRHGKPPFMLRGAYSAVTAFSRARGRYLGAIDEDAVAGASAGTATLGARAAGGARAVAGAGAGARAMAGTGAGSRAAAGVGAAASVGTAARRPRSAG